MVSQRGESFGANSDDWPLVVITGPRVPDKFFTGRLMEQMGAVLDRNERFCILADMTDAVRFELAEIRSLAGFAKENGDRIDQQVAALGFAVPSAMVRGAIKVLFTFRSPGHPYLVARTREAALAYLDPHLVALRPSQTG